MELKEDISVIICFKTIFFKVNATDNQGDDDTLQLPSQISHEEMKDLYTFKPPFDWVNWSPLYDIVATGHCLKAVYHETNK